eukprot:6296733-Amphidinium_carterae.1
MPSDQRQGESTVGAAERAALEERIGYLKDRLRRKRSGVGGALAERATDAARSKGRKRRRPS